MEVQTASWPSIDHGAARSDDGGVTEPADHPRQPSQSLDQQAADILKLFGETNDDGTNIPSMGMESFLFDDSLAPQFGAMDQDNTHVAPLASSNGGSSSSSSTYDSNMNHLSFGPWSTRSDPLTFGYQQTALQPAPQWMSDTRFDQPMTFTHHGGDGLGIHMPPTSNPIAVPTIDRFDGGAFVDHHASPIDARDDYGRQNFSNGWQHLEQTVPTPENIFSDEAEEDVADSADPCYAQLLHKCLKEAPLHTLSLRELYDWVSQHSQKAKDPNNRGWQNSVRHNLSMNAAFQRVTDRTSASKKGSLWRLTEEALRDGVISTTRYRKDPKRKPERRAVPALNRQASGAKGGRATRDASRMRQQQQQQQQNYRGPVSTNVPTSSTRYMRRSDRYHPNFPSPRQQQQQQGQNGYATSSPYSTPQSPATHPGFVSSYATNCQFPLATPTSLPSSPYFSIYQAEDDNDNNNSPNLFQQQQRPPPPLLHQQDYSMHGHGYQHPHLQGYHQATPEDFLSPPPPPPPPSAPSAPPASFVLCDGVNKPGGEGGGVGAAGEISSFEFLPLENSHLRHHHHHQHPHQQGMGGGVGNRGVGGLLFGDQDPELLLFLRQGQGEGPGPGPGQGRYEMAQTPTPSLMTEASFGTDG